MNMKQTLYIIMAALAFVWVTACKDVSEEPELNRGYDSNFRVPDPEPMTAEDSAFVAAQQAEYEQNAK